MGNSGAQAQLAASQAATSANAEAAANALAFSRQVYEEQKQLEASRRAEQLGYRFPYAWAGESGIGGAMALLGINAPRQALHAGGGGGDLLGGSGGGATSSLKGLAGLSSTSSRNPSSGPRTSPTAPPSAPPVGKPATGTPYGGIGQDPQYLGASKTFDEGAFRRYEQPLGPDEDAIQQPLATIKMFDSTGAPRDVPSSLVPFYQSRGYTF